VAVVQKIQHVENDACHTHHPSMPITKLFLYDTDTQRRNADFQYIMRNKSWQLLAIGCNSSFCVLPEPRELLQLIRANFVRKNNLPKSRNL